VKLPIYAAANIAEYIVINLQKNVVLIHSLPEGDRYKEVVTLGSADTLLLKTADGQQISVSVSELLS